MRENWHRFVEVTETKSKEHERAANYWDNVHTFFSLVTIFLGAATTFLSLIKFIPAFAISGVAAANTLISTFIGFMKPHDRRQKQELAAKEFRVLMMKMVRTETEREYEELWRELNKALLEEPSVPGKNNADKMMWSITPELLMVIGEKEQEVVKALGEDAIDTAERAHELSMSIPFFKTTKTPRGTPRGTPLGTPMGTPDIQFDYDDENYRSDKELLPKK